MSYLFKCSDCQKEFEIVADMGTIIGLKPFCPDCRSSKTIRKYTGLNFILRGSGWGKEKRGQEQRG